MELQKSQFIPQSVERANEPVNSQTSVFGSSKSVTENQAWIVAYLAKLLGFGSNKSDVKVPFDRYGLDSLAAIGMTGELENRLGSPIDPTLIYYYPTIESFARHLTEEF